MATKPPVNDRSSFSTIVSESPVTRPTIAHSSYGMPQVSENQDPVRNLRTTQRLSRSSHQSLRNCFGKELFRRVDLPTEQCRKSDHEYDRDQRSVVVSGFRDHVSKYRGR